jgi:hypothetical protein
MDRPADYDKHANYFDDSPKEMKRFYFDALNAGESRGMAMPR